MKYYFNIFFKLSFVTWIKRMLLAPKHDALVKRKVNFLRNRSSNPNWGLSEQWKEALDIEKPTWSHVRFPNLSGVRLWGRTCTLKTNRSNRWDWRSPSESGIVSGYLSCQKKMHLIFYILYLKILIRFSFFISFEFFIQSPTYLIHHIIN